MKKIVDIEYIKFDDAPEAWFDRCSGDGYEKDTNSKGERVYKDIGIAVGDLGFRPCAKCGKYPTLDGDDACIANLGRVMNACCGHGKNEGYIQFDNGITVRGHFKIEKSDPCDMEYEVKLTEEMIEELVYAIFYEKIELEDPIETIEQVKTFLQAMNI